MSFLILGNRIFILKLKAFLKKKSTEDLPTACLYGENKIAVSTLTFLWEI